MKWNVQDWIFLICLRPAPQNKWSLFSIWAAVYACESFDIFDLPSSITFSKAVKLVSNLHLAHSLQEVTPLGSYHRLRTRYCLRVSQSLRKLFELTTPELFALPCLVFPEETTARGPPSTFLLLLPARSLLPPHPEVSRGAQHGVQCFLPLGSCEETRPPEPLLGQLLWPQLTNHLRKEHRTDVRGFERWF